jgi:hypothetical protein
VFIVIVEKVDSVYKIIYLGSFSDKNEAIMVRRKAKEKYLNLALCKSNQILTKT